MKPTDIIDKYPALPRWFFNGLLSVWGMEERLQQDYWSQQNASLKAMGFRVSAINAEVYGVGPRNVSLSIAQAKPYMDRMNLGTYCSNRLIGVIQNDFRTLLKEKSLHGFMFVGHGSADGRFGTVYTHDGHLRVHYCPEFIVHYSDLARHTVTYYRLGAVIMYNCHSGNSNGAKSLVADTTNFYGPSGTMTYGRYSAHPVTSFAWLKSQGTVR